MGAGTDTWSTKMGILAHQEPTQPAIDLVLDDVFKDEATLGPDGRRIHVAGQESQPIECSLHWAQGTTDDGIVIEGEDFMVVVENIKGQATVHVWHTKEAMGNDPDITLRAGESGDG